VLEALLVCLQDNEGHVRRAAARSVFTLCLYLPENDFQSRQPVKARFSQQEKDNNSVEALMANICKSKMYQAQKTEQDVPQPVSTPSPHMSK